MYTIKELQANPAVRSTPNPNPSSNLKEKYLDLVRGTGSERKIPRSEELRAAREEMNKHFLLSPEIWSDWAADEKSHNTSDTFVVEVEKIYERGVEEFMSISLWCEYINYLRSHDQSMSQCSPSGLGKIRDLFERALTPAGLHFTEGSKLWTAYRSFEIAILNSMVDDNGEKVKQISRIRDLFKRQLSLPLSDMDSTFAEYKNWEQGIPNVPDSKIESIYNSAKTMYDSRKQYEDQLMNAGAFEKLKIFQKYIKFEESSKNIPRVQVIYERAVMDFPFETDLWLQYIHFMDSLQSPLCRAVYARASKNCRQANQLWVRYLRMMERIGASEAEQYSVFQKALQSEFPTTKQYLDIYMERIYSLRRRLVNGLDFQLIKEAFMDAEKCLSLHLEIKDLLSFYDNWAELEYFHGNGISAARQVWENTLEKRGSFLEVWKHYISMEINKGYLDEARALYKRCYICIDGSVLKDLCKEWMKFEGENGTLKDRDYAEQMYLSNFSNSTSAPNAAVPTEKLFDLFMSEDQISYSCGLLNVLKDNPVLKYVKVPGLDNPVVLYGTPTKVSIAVIDAIIIWVLALNFAGYTLAGGFSIEDFFISPITGSLKAHHRLMSRLTRLEGKGPSQRPDTHAVVVIIKDKIFKGLTLPHDVCDLVELLENYEERYEILVRNHPSLKDEIGKLEMFGSLYKQLQRLFETEREKFHRICAGLPYCDFNGNHWKFKATGNNLLKSILSHEPAVRELTRKLNATLGLQAEEVLQGGSRLETPPETGAKLTKLDALKVTMAMDQDPDLELLMDENLQHLIREAIDAEDYTVDLTSVTLDAACATFFRVKLDSLGFNHFDHLGNGLLKSLRHSKEHIKLHLELEYHQLEHLFGHTYQGLICQFVRVMALEGELVNSMSLSVSLSQILQNKQEN